MACKCLSGPQYHLDTCPDSPIFKKGAKLEFSDHIKMVIRESDSRELVQVYEIFKNILVEGMTKEQHMVLITDEMEKRGLVRR